VVAELVPLIFLPCYPTATAGGPYTLRQGPEAGVRACWDISIHGCWTDSMTTTN